MTPLQIATVAGLGGLALIAGRKRAPRRPSDIIKTIPKRAERGVVYSGHAYADGRLVMRASANGDNASVIYQLRPRPHVKSVWGDPQLVEQIQSYVARHGL